MAALEFYFDGVQVTDPQNWADISIVYEFDKDTRIFGKYINTDLTFAEDGYRYLYNKYIDEGFCGEVQIIVNKCESGSKVNIHSGIIFLSEIEFDLTKCTATCNVSDNSYYAYIKNNVDLVWSLAGTNTKNGETISIPKTRLNFGGGSKNRDSYKVYDVFDFIIGCMTDLRVDFISDYFSIGHSHTDFNNLAIFMGREIRTCEKTVAPILSWSDFFDEINKKCNIAGAIEVINGIPTLRIENYSYFFQTTNNPLSQLNSDNVKLSTDTDVLYSIVNIGSDATEFDANDSYDLDFPPARFVGWSNEKYNIINNCNIRNTLDLVSTFKIDSNSIEDIVTYDSDAYDDDIFLIDYTISFGINRATQSDFLGIGYDYTYQQPYNEVLNNQNTAQRWLGAIPANIALYLGDGNDGFEANRGSNLVITDLAAGIDYTEFNPSYPTEVSDPNNNYIDPIFTVGADGLYDFQVNHDLNVTFNSGTSLVIQTILWVRNGPSGDLTYSQFDTITSDGTHTVTINKRWYLRSCDQVYIERVFFNGLPAVFDIDVTWKSSSTFKTTQTVTGGGIYQTYNPADMKVLVYDFDTDMEFDTFDTLTDIDNYRLKVSIDDGQGWLRRIEHEIIKGKAQITLVNDGN